MIRKNKDGVYMKCPCCEKEMLNYMVQNPDFLQKFKVLLGVGN